MLRRLNLYVSASGGVITADHEDWHRNRQNWHRDHIAFRERNRFQCLEK